MNLELLISPSGLGKTQLILKDIEKNRNNNKIIVITPDQNSFNFESMLCEKFGGTFNIDVMNFSTLTKKLSSLLYLESLKNLGEEIKPFYFYKAALNLVNTNNFLVHRILQDSSFIEVVDDIIRELKEYKVSINLLEEYLEKNSSLEQNRREKLQAILEIYIEYTSLLKSKIMYDKQDYINEILLYFEYLNLEEYIFYIDGYYNFTPQEYSYVEKLITKSKKVVLSIIADANRYFNIDLNQLAIGYELENIRYKPFYLEDLHKEEKYKLDIFRKSHEIMASMNEILRRSKDIKLDIVAFVENSKQITTVILNINSENKISSYKMLDTHTSRFSGDSNSVIATRYYKNFRNEYEEDNSVEIIRAKNKELEVKEVAREIIKLKNTKGLKNSDIAILYRDNVYEDYIDIFSDYNLEIHLDKDIDVNNHRLIKFLDISLNFTNLDFKTALINILKTKLTNFENIYRRKVLSYIVSKKTTLSEKEIEEHYLAMSNEKLSSSEFKIYGLINEKNEQISLDTLYKKIKIISVDELENILNENFIISREILEEGKFISNEENNENFTLAICREILVELLEKIYKICQKETMQTKSYIRHIEGLFNHCNIRMYLDKEDGEYDDIEELKIDSIDRQVYKKTLQFFKSIVDNFGSEKLKYSKFVELVNLGLKTIKYRSIPEINESIIMSTMDLAKVENKKIVFVIGFNKDILPLAKNSGLLDDEDKETLYKDNIFLSPTVGASLIDEEFVAYIALTRASEKTYISYSLLDKSFKENFASPYLNVVKNLLPNLEEKSTSRILEFNIADYNYYLENIGEILTVKEYNYLFSKIYRRFMLVKDSETKEAEELSRLLVMFLDNYEKSSEIISNKKQVVYGQLTDKIYLDKDTAVKNYLDKIIRDYKFELSLDTIKEFLQQKEKSFSKFSISKISDFEKNPYLFFIKRVLGIKQEKVVDIDNLVIGRFFHAVMADERVIDFIKVSSEKFDVDFISDDDITRKFEIKKLINYVIASNDNTDIIDTLNLIDKVSTNSYILQNMIKRLELAIAVEIKYCALTKYMPVFLEKEFKLKITKNIISCEELGTGKIITKKLKKEYSIPEINFVGFIDRIDISGENISVIDYKSSQTDFSLESLELGFISQILTYSLACEMLLNKKTEDILGIFYREIAKAGKMINTYRLRGLGNKDVIVNSDFMESNAEVMYIRTTKKGGIHGSDDYKAYTSSELDKLVERNLNNVLNLLETIYNFSYSLEKYEVEDNYKAEEQTLFNYATNQDTRLEYKEKVVLKAKDLKKKILSE